jgi:hypothetical protein
VEGEIDALLGRRGVFSFRFVCYHQMSVHLSVLIVQTRATQVIIYLHQQHISHINDGTACGVCEIMTERRRSDCEGF